MLQESETPEDAALIQCLPFGGPLPPTRTHAQQPWGADDWWFTMTKRWRVTLLCYSEQTAAAHRRAFTVIGALYSLIGESGDDFSSHEVHTGKPSADSSTSQVNTLLYCLCIFTFKSWACRCFCFLMLISVVKHVVRTHLFTFDFNYLCRCTDVWRI